MKNIELSKVEKVLIITINREKELNALNSELLTELNEVLNSIDYSETSVLIITGAGEKAFVAGADISEMVSMTPSQARTFSQKGNELFRSIETLNIPVIAAVNGYALGGGNELAMACDICLASDNAVFGQPEVGLGITPGFGGTQRLSRTVGARKAKELIFTARNIKAQEAYDIGLVNQIYPVEKLMDAALLLANRISKNSSVAIKKAKHAINQGIEIDIESGMKIEEDLFCSCFKEEDQSQRMNNFLEGKKSK